MFRAWQCRCMQRIDYTGINSRLNWRFIHLHEVSLLGTTRVATPKRLLVTENCIDNDTLFFPDLRWESEAERAQLRKTWLLQCSPLSIIENHTYGLVITRSMTHEGHDSKIKDQGYKIKRIVRALTMGKTS